MPCNELADILAAPDLQGLQDLGTDLLGTLGAYRVEIDGTVVLENGDRALTKRSADLPVLPGSQARLVSQHIARDSHIAVAVAVVNTHVRLVLQDYLERRVVFSDRHVDAVERTIDFLGQLDEERARIGIVAACMEVADASLASLFERSIDGWQVGVDMGLPADMILPFLERETDLRMRVIDLPVDASILVVPLGSPAGTPTLVVLADWTLSEEEAFPLLQTVARLGQVALDNARLVRVAEERQRLRVELEVAGRTQEQLMPTQRPLWPGLDVVGYSQPSANVGGDYFDWFERPGRGYAICVADVSGHGVSAAIVMATLRGYLRAAFRHDDTLDTMLRDVSSMLCAVLEPWQFVTVFLAELSEDLETLSYCNAGHEPGLLVRDLGSVERLDAGAPPLGIDPALTPPTETVPLRAGDVLVVPTDGLAEAENSLGVQIGRDSLEEWVVRHVRESRHAEGIRERLLGDVERHRNGADRSDDETLVVVRRKGAT